MEDKFYKLASVNSFLKETNRLRQQLVEELINSGTDNNIVDRRLTMLSDLAKFELQALAKIKNFKTNNVDDYSDGRDLLLRDLRYIVSRNA